MSIMHKIYPVFIGFINPRLHHFTRPALLAIVIALPTFVISAMVFSYQLDSCVTTISQYTSNPSDQYDFVRSMREQDFDVCVSHGTYRFATELGSAVEIAGCKLEEGWRVGTLFEPGATRPDDFSNIPLCEQAKQKGEENYPWCEMGTLKAVTVEYKLTKCESLDAALGTALAYSAYIEMLFTVVFIMCLLKLKIIKSLHKFSWSDVLEEEKMEDGSASNGIQGSTTRRLQDTE